MWHQKGVFSGKMTILSYITIFGPTFSAILENLLELFFAMSQKLRFWAKMAIFSHVRPNLGKMRIFHKKRALLSFYPYCPPNFMPSFGKTLGEVSEINCVTAARTNERTRVILKNRSLRWFNKGQITIRNSGGGL